MGEAQSKKRVAIEALARHLQVPWGERGDNAWFLLEGKRIALEFAIAERTDLTKPHLRFDKVARRLIGHVQEALRASVPKGKVVLVTVTAPMHLASRTASALEAAVRDQLARETMQADCNLSIHGNQVRVRLVQSRTKLCSNVIGYVHNPGTDAGRLLDIAQQLLQLVEPAAPRRPRARSVSERWLAILVEGGAEQMAAYRQVYEQLSIAADFARILMVSSAGRVETLVA
jgi:hypothetical protein